MKKFNIKVNGKAYEVEVEEIGSSAPSFTAPAAPAVSAPVNETKSAPAPAPAPVNAGSSSIKAPMPGTINAVKVTAGESIKKGQVVAVLEAMKMENEIMAPQDGTITSVAVMKGATVESGDLLCTIQ